VDLQGAVQQVDGTGLKRLHHPWLLSACLQIQFGTGSVWNRFSLEQVQFGNRFTMSGNHSGHHGEESIA
jgi:hypothetical protein